MTDYSRLSVDQRTIQQLMEKLLEAERAVVANINQHSIMFETLTRCQMECTELTLRVRELEAKLEVFRRASECPGPSDSVL